MKTTVEIPDELLRRIRIRAIHDNKKLKDEITTLLERGMARDSSFEHVEIPFQLKGEFQPTAEDIRRAIDMGRES
jgi:hypothetical protein